MYSWDMNPRKSLLGKTFGILTVLKRVGQVKPGGVSVWLCRCECGTEKEFRYNHLVGKTTKSCGCMIGKWPRKPRKKKAK